MNSYSLNPYKERFIPSTYNPYESIYRPKTKNKSEPIVFVDGQLQSKSTETKSPIMYPTTHSMPGPYLQSYINLPNRSFAY